MEILSAENPDLTRKFRKKADRVFRAAAWAATFRLGILSLYLRRNKELEKGSFSIVVFLTTPNETSCILTLSFFLSIGFVHELLGSCWRREREREHDEIGVPDRPREEESGLDSSYYLMKPFAV